MFLLFFFYVKFFVVYTLWHILYLHCIFLYLYPLILLKFTFLYVLSKLIFSSSFLYVIFSIFQLMYCTHLFYFIKVCVLYHTLLYYSDIYIFLNNILVIVLTLRYVFTLVPFYNIVYLFIHYIFICFVPYFLVLAYYFYFL